MRKLIIDTDTGIDDTVAILMAYSQPDIELVGITSVFGTSSLENTTKNIIDVCGLAGINTRIGKGADKAICKPKRTPQKGGFHGENGVGDVILPCGNKELDPMKAWDLIYDEACKLDGELEVMTLGPTTNLAIALLKYPDLYKKIKALWMMGGSAKTGNVTAHSEANFFGDPLATEIVFQSGIEKIVMVGLNATEQCRLTTKEINHLFSVKTCMHPYIDGMLATYKNSQNKNGEQGNLINDGVAMSVCINEKIAELVKKNVHCEMAPTSNEGRSVVDFRPYADGPKNVYVTMAIDKEAYKEILSNTIDFLAKA